MRPSQARFHPLRGFVSGRDCWYSVIFFRVVMLYESYGSITGEKRYVYRVCRLMLREMSIS